MRVTRNYMNSLLGAKSTNGMSSLLQRALSRSSKGRRTNRNMLLTKSANNTRSPFGSMVKTTGNTQKAYYNMKYHASQVSDYAQKLTSKEDSSIFARAEENKSTSEVVANIKGFIGQYNGMIQNLKDSGNKSYSNYVTQLNTIAGANSKELASCGITRKSDGTLAVDEKKLAATDLDTLKKVWNGNGFVGRAAIWADAIETSAKNSMEAESKTAYSDLINNYGSKGSYFNFLR